MTFAIFYDTADMTPVESAFNTALTAGALSQSDRQLAAKIWNGGLKDWKTAPIASVPRQEGDADTHQIVISASGVSLLDMRNLMYRIVAAIPGTSYLVGIADDMSRSSGAQEPWP